MKKATLSFCFLLFISTSFSQLDPVTGNLSGQVYSVHGKLATGFVESFKSGSPFFDNNWMNSSVVLIDGREINNLKTKINLMTDEVYYLENNTAYVADSPIKEIIVLDENGKEKTRFTNLSVLNLANKKSTNGWHLLNVSGPASLYTRLEKVIEEDRQYSSATVDRSIITKKKYLLYYNYATYEIKKLKDIISVLPDKKAELEKYIQQKELKSSEEDYRKLVTYYNSLQAK